MINYYLRPDGAHLRIDEVNKVATNVLNISNHKFIGQITNPDYVDGMIGMSDKFTPVDEATFNAAFQEAKSFLLSLS